MSTYTDYDTVSRTYDEGRVADGADIMVMVLSGLLKKDPSQIHLLEAGCGTGNFSIEFSRNGIGKLTMIDASKGMLEKATEKVKDISNQVESIKQVILPKLPFENDSFDAIALIQVIHHLDSYHIQNEDNFAYPGLTECLNEAHRVLKPSGILMIDHSSEENLNQLPIVLAPKAFAILKKMFVAEEVLLKKIKEATFKDIFYIVRPDSTYVDHKYKENFEIVLNPKWRAVDSSWDIVERTGEMAPLLEKLNRLKDEGKLGEFIKAFYNSKKPVGDRNVIFAKKQ